MTPPGPISEPLSNYLEHPPEEMGRRARAFYEDIRRRRTVRDFSARPVAAATVEACLLAAGTAPSGANMQPWHFVVVSDPSVKRRIREAAEQEERLFYRERAPQEWLDAIAPLGTDEHKPFLETAPYLIAIFAETFGQLPDGRGRGSETPLPRRGRVSPTDRRPPLGSRCGGRPAPGPRRAPCRRAGWPSRGRSSPSQGSHATHRSENGGGSAIDQAIFESWPTSNTQTSTMQQFAGCRRGVAPGRRSSGCGAMNYAHWTATAPSHFSRVRPITVASRAWLDHHPDSSSSNDCS